MKDGGQLGLDGLWSSSETKDGTGDLAAVESVPGGASTVPRAAGRDERACDKIAGSTAGDGEACSSAHKAAGSRRTFNIPLSWLSPPPELYSSLSAADITREAQRARVCGSLSPIVVRGLRVPTESEHRFEIVGGEMQYLVASKLGRDRVYVRLGTSEAFDRRLLELCENVKHPAACAWDVARGLDLVRRLVAERVGCPVASVQQKTVVLVTGIRKETTSLLLNAVAAVADLRVSADEPGLKHLGRDGFRIVLACIRGGERDKARRICRTGRVPKRPIDAMALDDHASAVILDSGALQITLEPVALSRPQRRRTRSWGNGLISGFIARQRKRGRP